MTSSEDNDKDILHFSLLLLPYKGHAKDKEVLFFSSFHTEEGKGLDLCCKDKTKDLVDPSLSSLSPDKEDSKNKDNSGLSSACLPGEGCVAGRHKCLVLI